MTPLIFNPHRKYSKKEKRKILKNLGKAQKKWSEERLPDATGREKRVK